MRRIEDRGAAARRDRGDRLGHGRAVVGRAGDRAERLGERHDQHPILRAHEAAPAGWPPRARSRSGATCSGCCRSAARRSPAGPPGGPGRASAARRLRAPGSPCASRLRDEAPGLVLHRGVEQHAGHVGRLGRSRAASARTVSRAVLPRLSATATAISRGSNGFSSTHSTA